MSLLTWQTALAEFVTARASDDTAQLRSAGGPSLTARESTWLAAISSSAGFKLTCDVQRWWREFRIQQAAPLTLGALNAEWRALLMAEYIRRHGRPSSFFLREALPFLDLANELAYDVPHIAALAAFERAMLRLGHALADNPGLAQVHELRGEGSIEADPLAEVVRFQAPPGQVLAAASRGLPFPAVEDQSYWILVAPGLSNLAAGCTSADVRLLQSIRAGTIDLPTALEPALVPAFQRLWSAGALRHTA
ncbi:MAG: hypothetical protein JO318_16040 [Chloroflexi bacterium]|nr:hypothetical protein [Chloroflexota bacterium]